jgi:hypothetical protein
LRHLSPEPARTDVVRRLTSDHFPAEGKVELKLSGDRVEAAPLGPGKIQARFGPGEQVLPAGITRQELKMSRPRNRSCMAIGPAGRPGRKQRRSRGVEDVGERFPDPALLQKPAPYHPHPFIIGASPQALWTAPGVVEYVEQLTAELVTTSRLWTPSEHQSVRLQRVGNCLVKEDRSRRWTQNERAGVDRRAVRISGTDGLDEGCRHDLHGLLVKYRQEGAKATPGHLCSAAVEALELRSGNEAIPNNLYPSAIALETESQGKGHMLLPNPLPHSGREIVQLGAFELLVERGYLEAQRSVGRAGKCPGHFPHREAKALGIDLIARGQPCGPVAKEAHSKPLLAPGQYPRTLVIGR